VDGTWACWRSGAVLFCGSAPFPTTIYTHIPVRPNAPREGLGHSLARGHSHSQVQAYRNMLQVPAAL
jgi:hypothetical protein